VAVAVGCAGPTLSAVGAPAAGGRPCAVAASGAGPEAFGFALAWLDPAVPRELEALAAWVEKTAAQTALTVAPPGEGDLVGIAGPSRCPDLEPSRVLVEGEPPRLRAGVADAAQSAQESLAQGHLAAGRFPEGRAAWQEAARHQALPVPASGLGVAASYADEERWTEALAIYQELVARFPWSPEAQAGLGRVLRATARRVEAVEAWSRAMALRPRSPAVRAVVVADAFAELRPPLIPPATRLESEGTTRWVQVAAPDRDPGNPMVVAEAAAYAACKEAFRASADLRRAATGRDLPGWIWTPAEESVCAALWLRAYLRNRGQGRAADAGLDTLEEIARDGFLDERALYDVGAWVHAPAPLLLDRDRRTRLFAFVEKFRVGPRRDAGWLFP
jgi:tetratricopeptide (TPR) repeat protein